MNAYGASELSASEHAWFRLAYKLITHLLWRCMWILFLTGYWSVTKGKPALASYLTGSLRCLVLGDKLLAS